MSTETLPPLTPGEINLRRQILKTRQPNGDYELTLSAVEVEGNLGITAEHLMRLGKEWPVSVSHTVPDVIEGADIQGNRYYTFFACERIDPNMHEIWLVYMQGVFDESHDIKARVARNATADDGEGPVRSSPEAFAAYHQENPQVYEAFKTFTFELIHAGHTQRLGAKLIIERIRWQSLISGNDAFKVNNNYAPYYSRMFMEEFPQFMDIFATRSSGADAKKCE